MNETERAAEVVVSGALRSADHYSVPTDEWPGIAISAHNAYLWGKADAAIAVTDNATLKRVMSDYTEILIGPRPTEQESHDE